MILLLILFLNLIEGGCLAAAPTLDVQGVTTFCPGESLMIAAPNGFATYEWSNGETSSNIVVTESGNYQLTITDASGCFGFSSVIPVVVNPVLSPEIMAIGDTIICTGETVQLSEINEPNAASYTWSNGLTGNIATFTESGTYNVTVQGLCQDFISNSISVEVNPFPNAPVASGATIIGGEQAMLNATGNSLAWYDVPTGGSPLYIGENFTTPNIFTTTTYYVEDRTGLLGLNANVGQEEHSGTPFPNNPGDNNNSLIFDAFDEFTLDSVTVYTDVEGLRTIFIMDQNFNFISNKEVYILAGKSTIHLGFDIPIGNDFRITTDINTNINNLGTFGPLLQRSDENVNYPYTVQDVVSIKNSDFGNNWYYYFYDWKISKPGHECASDRTPVVVSVEGDVATFDISESSDLNVFPNPTNGEISIDLKFEITENISYRISDLAGRTVLENQLDLQFTSIQLGDLAKGIYMMQIIHGEDIYQGKIIFH